MSAKLRVFYLGTDTQSELLQMISGLHPSLGRTSHSIHALSSALNTQSSKLGDGAWAGIHRIIGG
jgi:hypothetical protein